MRDNILLGYRHRMIPIPGFVWRRMVAKQARSDEQRVARLMSREHHLVRDFAVRELPRAGKPLAPEVIAECVNLPLEQVNALLDDLEKRLIFVFRGDGRSVTWAYPVTVDTTPHRLHYSTGEQGYAA